MPNIHRRSFLMSSALASVAGGPIMAASSLPLAVAGSLCDDDGEVVPFSGEGRRPMGRPYGSGLDGRQLLDLRKLAEDRLVTDNDQFFIRTRYPSELDPADAQAWKLKFGGLVDQEQEIVLSDLQDEVEDMGVHVMECSGNGRFGGFGLMSAAQWSGFRVTKLLDRIKPQDSATAVMIAGFDQHARRSRNSRRGASWVFTFDQLKSTGAFLATRMNQQAIPQDHGFPVRLVVPGWYGCTSAKWVDTITLVDDNEPATTQMREFASRTHQRGVPELAKDYRAASMDLAAMPVRVQKKTVDGNSVYTLTGIIWGGDRATDKLVIRFNRGTDYVPVDSYEHKTNQTWTLWRHRWTPDRPGRYRIQLQVDDPEISTQRLDRGFYTRSIEVT